MADEPTASARAREFVDALLDAQGHPHTAARCKRALLAYIAELETKRRISWHEAEPPPSAPYDAEES